MKFNISCATFCRLASITSYFDPNIDEELRNKFSCVRIENKGGHVYAIATNQKIAAIEYLGNTTELDGVAHVVVDPVLVNQAKNESAWNSFIEIQAVPEMAFAAAKTMMGFSYKNNACIWPDKTPMDDWRKWGPDEPPKKNNGAMFWNLDYMQALFDASPSGKISFPEFIDIDIPVVMRDRKNKDWVGLFMPHPKPNEEKAKPATLPDWWNQ